MKKFATAMIFLTGAIISYAQPPQQPTPSSKPLPNLQQTQNIDTVLREKVQDKISKTPLLKNQTVSAGAHDQIIVLEGSVENKEQEAAAITAAKSVPGVKEVRSQLNIKYETPQEKK